MKEKGISLVVTIFIHLFLALLLLQSFIQPYSNERSEDQLSGVPVMLGNIKDAAINKEVKGKYNGLVQEIIEQTESNLSKANELNENNNNKNSKTHELKDKSKIVDQTIKNQTLTQKIEQTIPIETEINREKDKEYINSKTNNTKSSKQLENEKKLKEESSKRKNINNQMAELFANVSDQGSRGNTIGQEILGSPAGNSNMGKLSGTGGTGTYDLGGRGIGSTGLQLPSYHVDDYGTVVVDIIVDPQGKVIEATIGKGTNTTNSSLRNESIRAAKSTQFSIVNTTNNQKGTITYKFNLN